MTTTVTLAFAIIALGLAANVVAIVMAVRRALEGRQSPIITRALLGLFAAIVAGVGLLAVSLDFEPARSVGIVVIATAFAAAAIPLLLGRRKSAR